MLRQRGWYWTPLFDRWQVLAALLLAALFIVLVLRSNQSPAPVFTAPAANAQLPANALGNAAGTARANQAIRLFDSNDAIGNVQADAGGHWSLPLPALTPGQHTLFARVIDGNGRVLASSQPLNLTVLPAPAPTPTPAVVVPTITTPAPGAQLTSGNLGDLAGSGRPGDALRIFDGDTPVGEVTVGPDGAWRLPFPTLGSGNHTITARVMDANGNLLAASLPLDIRIVDAATPGATPGAGGTPGTTPGLTPGAGATPSSTPGAGSTPGATPGASATPTPAGGRVEAPVLTSALVSPLHTRRPLFSGTAAPGVKVRIYDGDQLLGEVTADAAGRWSFTPPTALAVGDHVLRLAAVDPDGREVFADPRPFTIAADAQPAPPPTINLPPGGQLPAGERLTGAAPPNSTVTIFAGDKALGVAQVGADGAWQFNVPADLTPGDYDFKVTAQDASGNLLGESLPVRIKILPPVGLPVTGGDLSGQ